VAFITYPFPEETEPITTECWCPLGDHTFSVQSSKPLKGALHDGKPILTCYECQAEVKAELEELETRIATEHARLIAEIGVEGLTLTMFGGSCPFQVEGALLGFDLYFRSRGRYWSIRLSDAQEDIVWSHEEAYAYSREHYADDLSWAECYAAGYISREEVVAILKQWLPVAISQIGRIENA
jgi:hypothetical protein